jgi:cytochrome b
LGVVVVRIAWGFAGPHYARFAQFVRGPRRTLAYARLVIVAGEPRHIGHNPLGAWMILALLACVAGLALTGWLYTTDRFWGDETVERVHVALAWAMLGLVSLHAAGVVVASFRHRENLVSAMFSGDKRAPTEGDVA